MDATTPSPRKGHTRSRSATVLKSIISPSKRSSPRKQSPERVGKYGEDTREASPSRVLGEIGNQGGKSPKKSTRATKKHQAEINPWTEPDTPLSPAESVLLSPVHSFAPKDKENTTPPRTGNSEPYTPIWAEFSSQPLGGLTRRDQQMQDSPQNPQRRADKSPTRSPRQASQGAQTVTHNRPTAPVNVVTGSRPASRDPPKKSSRVLEAVAKLDNSGRQLQERPVEKKLEGTELDEAFEVVLSARNIPENRRVQMRGLDANIKRDFIKNDIKAGAMSDNGDSETGSHVSNSTSKRSKRDRSQRRNEEKGAENEGNSMEEHDSPSKRRSRSRSRTFTFSKGDRSKKSRSQSRPRSLMSLRNLSSSSVNSIGLDGSSESKDGARRRADPDEFVGFLKDGTAPEKIEVGKLQKLRRLLRHESVAWVDEFIGEGGMDAVVGLLQRIMKVEWREEHEDMLLHEALLCLKGLCTTARALAKLDELKDPFFQELVNMLFDDERRGPAEYGTRGIITFLFFTHLSSAKSHQREECACMLLSYLADPQRPADDRPADFISQMAKPRPYQRWCKETTNVTKEVFWIFLHHLNTVPCSPTGFPSASEPYSARHFPRERPPVPAAPYVGGVEWEATNYLASHLDLMNGFLASIPVMSQRNRLREELRASGFEQLMGGTLRLCKEKFYGAVHDGLRTWVDAAAEDGWETFDVRQGPAKPLPKSTPASPQKKMAAPPPRLELPLGLGDRGRNEDERHVADDGWQI